MADQINGCEIRQCTYSDNSMIEDKCFEPVAIIGMGESLLSISCSFALIKARLSMAGRFHTTLGVMGIPES